MCQFTKTLLVHSF
ncbi:hypothetical protein ACHAXR_002991 [Thalassiosira sp. AJA248-18]